MGPGSAEIGVDQAAAETAASSEPPMVYDLAVSRESVSDIRVSNIPMAPPDNPQQRAKWLSEICWEQADYERLWRRDRRGYFNTLHWRTTRRIFLASHGLRCDDCGKTKRRHLTVHHLHYDTLGCETADDLAGLCKKCHNARHDRQQTPGWSPAEPCRIRWELGGNRIHGDHRRSGSRRGGRKRGESRSRARVGGC